MPIRYAMRFKTGLFAVLFIVLLLGLWLWIREQGLWAKFIVWIMQTQSHLHQQLAGKIRLVAQEGWTASWSLIVLSLLYGLFHAAGPGHGKAVITTYLGTSRTRLRRGLVLSLTSALLQGIVAIVLVEVFAGLLGHTLRHTQAAATKVENLSFAFVIVLGAVLMLRCSRLLYRHWQRPPAPPASLFSGQHTKLGSWKNYCIDCNGPHQIAATHLGQKLTWRNSAPILLSIGLRPCTGAILVLLVAYSLNLRWIGMASVLAMSLGTAFTVSLLATLAVSMRQGLLFFLQRSERTQRTAQVVLDVVGVIGGLCIMLLGIALLQKGLYTPAHPLF